MKKLTIILALIGILFLFGCVKEKTEYYSGNVYLPSWGHLYCGMRSEQINQYFSLPDSSGKVEYFCGSPTVRAYLPNGCDFFFRSNDIKNPLINIPNFYLCDGNAQSFSECNKIKITLIGEVFMYRLNYGQKIVVDGYHTVAYDLGDYQIRIVAQPYGIWNQELGHLIVTSSCDVKSLGAGYTEMFEDYRADNYEEGTVLKVGHIVNYVVGSVLISDPTNVIQHNGKLVYISQPSYYYDVIDGKDGKKYADTRTPNFDSSIVCVPSNPYCKDDASGIISDPSGKGCGALSGNIEGYVQVSSSEICKFRCVNDKLVKTSDCKDIPTQCPPEKPLWDSIKGECVGVGIINICGDGVCSGDETLINCPEDCSCKAVWSIFGVTIIPNISKECVGFFTPLTWITTIFAGLLTFFFTLMWMMKANKKSKNQWLNWTLAIIFGLGAGIIVYLYWWSIIFLIVFLLLLSILFRALRKKR